MCYKHFFSCEARPYQASGTFPASRLVVICGEQLAIFADAPAARPGIRGWLDMQGNEANKPPLAPV